MKKIITFLIFISLVFSLISCNDNKYPAVESTEEELKTVYTMKLDGQKYEIKYELYRALFISLKNEVDKGDDSVWSGADKAKYIAQIDELIIDRASDIFATFNLCKKKNINIYGAAFEDDIQLLIKQGVEGGGEFSGNIIEGYGSDYEKYLAALALKGINYSVQVMLLRYALAHDALIQHYVGNIDSYVNGIGMGELKYSDKDIENFYFGEDCVRVIYTYLDKKYFSETDAQEMRDKVAALSSADDVANYIIGNTTSGASDVINGVVIGKYSLDAAYYTEITKSAFEIDIAETSQIIKVNTQTEDGYVFLYRLYKDDEHLKNSHSNITNVYLNNEVGKIINEEKAGLIESVAESDYSSQLDRAEIVK